MFIARPLAALILFAAVCTVAQPGLAQTPPGELPPGWHKKSLVYDLCIETATTDPADYQGGIAWGWEYWDLFTGGWACDGVGMAYDTEYFTEALVSKSCVGKVWEVWEYVPESSEQGEVEAYFHLERKEGELCLDDAPSAAVIGVHVSFFHDIDGGASESLAENFGRSTGSNSLGSGSWMGVSLNFATHQKEGCYTIPKDPDIDRLAYECTNLYQYDHRTAIYVEAWADGWDTQVGPWDHAAAQVWANGKVSSSHSRRVCPE